MAGPNCGYQIAQMGTDVTKVEPPEGDWERYGDNPVLSMVNDRGKRSISVDLKNPRTTEAILRIAATCGVVIESFRPGVTPRFNSFAVRRDNTAELIRVLDDAFVIASTDQWMAALQKEEVMCSRVNCVADWLEYPHV